jgi:hypothetical protein
VLHGSWLRRFGDPALEDAHHRGVRGARSALPSSATASDEPGHHPLDPLTIGGFELVNLFIEAQVIDFEPRLWLGFRLALAGLGTLAGLRRSRRILPPDIDDGARPLPLGARPDPDGGVPRERRTVGIDANGDPLTPPPGVAR